MNHYEKGTDGRFIIPAELRTHMLRKFEEKSKELAVLQIEVEMLEIALRQSTIIKPSREVLSFEVAS